MVAWGLGSNLALHQALAVIGSAARALAGVMTNVRYGPVVRSRAESALPQPDYTNTVLAGQCDLPAARLLAFAKALELAAGRRAGPRNGPRPLDIDLLVAPLLQTSGPELELPHPRLAQRRFALAPLAAIAGELRPHGTATVAELLAALDKGPDDAVEGLVSTQSWPALGRQARVRQPAGR